jgi:glycosyltransferase involved in cell wall biosynthesis
LKRLLKVLKKTAKTVNEKTKRKKVLFVITKSVWGGASKYVYDLATNLKDDGFDAVVAAGGDGELVKKLRQAGVICYTIRNFQKSINVFKDIVAFFELLILLLRVKPDIIHGNSSKAAGIVGAAARFCELLVSGFSPLLVFTAHGWAFNEKRPKWQLRLIKLFSKITALFYDKIICVSEYDRKSAIRENIAPKEKLTTIRNGIKFDDYEFLNKENAIKELQKNSNFRIPISSKMEIIGTIGEFTKNKGQKYLIEATKSLATNKNCSFITAIIGWGEKETDLKSQILNSGLENQVFLIKNLRNPAKYIKAFTMFVLPSLKEGLPYIILEAGLARVPVIASKTGGVPEIIEDQKNGILVEPANVEELKKAIQALNQNKNFREEIAGNLQKKILKEFGLEKMLRLTTLTYKEQGETSK